MNHFLDRYKVRHTPPFCVTTTSKQPDYYFTATHRFARTSLERGVILSIGGSIHASLRMDRGSKYPWNFGPRGPSIWGVQLYTPTLVLSIVKFASPDTTEGTCISKFSIAQLVHTGLFSRNRGGRSFE